MNDLQIFKNTDFGSVRTLLEDGFILFCGSDVGRALGYARPYKAIIDHCKGVLKRDILTNGGVQEMLFIPRSDLYRLIAHSKLPAAEEFEKWIFEEVIPAIHDHGGYLTSDKLEEALTNPDVLIRLATDLKNERAEKARLAERIKQDRPKVLFADAVSASANTILVRDLAKLLKQNGCQTGEKRLFEQLRQEGYLMRMGGSSKNLPTQRAMEKGLFEISEHEVIS